MADYSGIINEKIARKIRRKLYSIVCEHVKNFDDEKALEHVKNFMEGVSWATGLRYKVLGGGTVYVYLSCFSRSEMNLSRYRVLNVYTEVKILRNSINRHYHKKGCPSEEEVYFYGRN